MHESSSFLFRKEKFSRSKIPDRIQEDEEFIADEFDAEEFEDDEYEDDYGDENDYHENNRYQKDPSQLANADQVEQFNGVFDNFRNFFQVSKYLIHKNQFCKFTL